MRPNPKTPYKPPAPRKQPRRAHVRVGRRGKRSETMKCSCGGNMKHTGSYKVGEDTYDTYRCQKCGRETEVRRPSGKHPLGW